MTVPHSRIPFRASHVPDGPPQCSVVTPCLRGQPWIRLCAASVGDQEGVTCEHLIEDGGSDDGTVEWLREHTRADVRSTADDGMYDALNRGFERARGAILCWLNADEQLLPGALASVQTLFAARPELDMIVADAVVVDHEGRYRFHRKMLPPTRAHTAVCHLGLLSCATFFRRSLLENRALRFDPRWRVVGDAEWILRVLASGARIGRLPQFTSVFTDTGANLSGQPEAVAERARLSRQASGILRLGRPLWMLAHRLRRMWAGCYRQPPFSFSLYTLGSPGKRVAQRVERPTGRWRKAAP